MTTPKATSVSQGVANIEAAFRRHMEANDYAKDLIKRIAFDVVPLAWKLASQEAPGHNKASIHAVNLEQCALFVDSAPIKKAMTDAAVFLRALASPEAPSPDTAAPASGAAVKPMPYHPGRWIIDYGDGLSVGWSYPSVEAAQTDIDTIRAASSSKPEPDQS